VRYPSRSTSTRSRSRRASTCADAEPSDAGQLLV
jgi:hypothetical protein